MRSIFVALTLAVAAVAQQCVCKSDPVSGFYTGNDCSRCDSSKTDKNAAAGQMCLGYSRCHPLYTALGTKQKACHGLATCNPDAAAGAMCDCQASNPQLAGVYCEKCQDGWANWPACDVQTCAAGGGSQNVCNGHGTCNDSKLRVSCGVTDNGRGALSYDRTTQTCHEMTDKVTGASVYRVSTTSENLVTCGTSLCQFGEACDESDELRPVCVPAGSAVCLDVNGNNVGTICSAKQVCCDGVCCASSQACVYQDKNVWQVMWNPPPVPGQATPPPFTTPQTVYASMSYQLPDGTYAKNTARQCSADKKMSGPSFMRIVVFPALLSVACLYSAFSMVGVVGMAPITIVGPALISVGAAVFLAWSMYWQFSICLTMSACVALAGLHKGGDVQLYGMVIQLLFLFITVGPLGPWLLSNNSAFPASIANSNSGNGGWSLLATCSNYFDHFDTQDIPAWDSDARYVGLCSVGWFTYLFMTLGIAVFGQVVMLVSSGIEYLQNSDAATLGSKV